MSAASGEPKVVAKLREEAQGRYDLEELSVEEGRELVAYIDRLAQQRDAAVRDAEARERELHDEAVMLHTALLGRFCAEEGAVSACHPMVCDCGTPYEDCTHRDLCEAVSRLRARLAACERVVDAAKVWAYYDDVTGPHGLDGTAWVNAVADAADALRAAVATAQEASVDDDFGPNDGHARTVNRSAQQEAWVLLHAAGYSHDDVTVVGVYRTEAEAVAAQYAHAEPGNTHVCSTTITPPQDAATTREDG